MSHVADLVLLTMLYAMGVLWFGTEVRVYNHRHHVCVGGDAEINRTAEFICKPPTHTLIRVLTAASLPPAHLRTCAPVPLPKDPATARKQGRMLTADFAEKSRWVLDLTGMRWVYHVTVRCVSSAPRHHLWPWSACYELVYELQAVLLTT